MAKASRRAFLKGLSAVAAAGVACKPEDKDGPSGDDTGFDLPEGIEHVVIVMMENRSFDHYFGALTLEEGRTDIDGLTAEMSNDSPVGTHYPYFEDAAFCPKDPPHSWGTSHEQFADGANSGFAQTMYNRHGTSEDPGVVMGYYNRSNLPIFYALADAYTICDNWYCSVMSSTWPNRLYSHGCTSFGATGNDLPETESGFFEFKLIWDQLDEIGESWGYYYSDAPFVMVFGAMTLRDEVQGIENFYQACVDGTLPKVSYVDPAFTFNDDHPPHHPMLGQIFLATVHNALAASPLWDKTLLIITYDEHGGYFDHVPPPKTDDDYAEQGFDQLGFRVPAIVAGGWAKRGHVSKVQYDHSSWIKHTQGLHGLEPLNKRNAAANDLSDCVAEAPAPPAELPVVPLTEAEILAQCEDAPEEGQPRSAHQPELEALLDSVDLPPGVDRRYEWQKVQQDALDAAVRFGACVVRHDD